MASNALKEPKTKRLRPAPAYPYGDKQRLVRLIIEPRPHQPRSGGAFSFGGPASVDPLPGIPGSEGPTRRDAIFKVGRNVLRPRGEPPAATYLQPMLPAAN